MKIGSNHDVVLAHPLKRSSDLVGTLEGAGGIGGLLARSTGYPYGSGDWTSHACYHADDNGNVTFMLNASQSMAARYRYDPFGNTISASGSLAGDNVYRFSSKEVHPFSGLYYYGYRFYDPYPQRWINRDPIGEEGEINLYCFVRNAPVNAIDYVGRQPFGPGDINALCLCRVLMNWNLTCEQVCVCVSLGCQPTPYFRSSHISDRLLCLVMFALGTFPDVGLF